MSAVKICEKLKMILNHVLAGSDIPPFPDLLKEIVW
jgi:hypothetical protein